MKRSYLIGALVAALTVAFGIWIANATAWEDTPVPMPLRGEAQANPFYAAQRFSESLGATAARSHALILPPADAVVVLSNWHWSLSTRRQRELEQWVASGGRLVIHGPLIGGEVEFEEWAGVEREFREFDDSEEYAEAFSELDECRFFTEETRDSAGSSSKEDRELCGADIFTVLRSQSPIEWALREELGMKAARVGIGRGSVTVINATPFTYREFLEGDHGRVFVTATQLRRGDHVLFVTEDDYPSILAIAWENGASVIVCLLTLVFLGLWRAVVRFGPLMPARESARRSLAEQIRGTGRFALRVADGASLHAACVRALDEAATHRVGGYVRMSLDERCEALSRHAHVDRRALAAARHDASSRQPHRLRSAIALLENTRRNLLRQDKR